MEQLTLRRVSGIVMLGNTFLPAIAVLTLALMAWSTAATIRNEACLIISELNESHPPSTPIVPEPCSCIDNKKSGSSGDAGRSCGLFAAIDYIFAVKLYSESLSALQRETDVMRTKALALGNAVDQAVTLELDVPDKRGLRRTVRKRFNDYVAEPLAKPVKKSLNAATNSLRQATYAVFQPQMDNMKVELRHALDKRDLVWERAKNTYTMQSRKFYWFFVALGLWLLLSYVIWVNRRLSQIWGLIHSQGKHRNLSV